MFSQSIIYSGLRQTDRRIYTGAVYSFARGSAMLVVDEVGWLVGDVVGTMKVLILIVLTGALLVDLTSGEGEGDASKESTTTADKGDDPSGGKDGGSEDGGKGNGTNGDSTLIQCLDCQSTVTSN